MKIFVQSAGPAPKQDYRWFLVGPEGEMFPEEPKFLDMARQWLDMESPSMLIWRSRDEVRFLVTNLPSTGRVDYRGRVVRNYFAIIMDVKQEKFARALAVRYLEDLRKFEHSINHAFISMPGSEYGFETKFGVAYLDEIKKGSEDFPSNTPPSEGWIGVDSEENRQKLAVELRRYCLPSKDAVIVVTAAVDPKSWAKNECPVWRCLTELASENDTGKETNRFKKLVQSVRKQFPLQRILGFLVVGALCFVLIWLFSYLLDQRYGSVIDDVMKAFDRFE